MHGNVRGERRIVYQRLRLLFALNTTCQSTLRVVEYINCQDHRGWTALHFAAEGGHIQCARLLMEASADPSIVNNQGLTASEVARDAGHVACAAFLDGYALMNSVLQSHTV
jgi:ankyrin repeat protein